MVCTHCGSPIPIENLECPECGRRKTRDQVLAEPPPDAPRKLAGVGGWLFLLVAYLVFLVPISAALALTRGAVGVFVTHSTKTRRSLRMGRRSRPGGVRSVCRNSSLEGTPPCGRRRQEIPTRMVASGHDFSAASGCLRCRPRLGVGERALLVRHLVFLPCAPQTRCQHLRLIY
jgi:hypothetical protein